MIVKLDKLKNKRQDNNKLEPKMKNQRDKWNKFKGKLNRS